MVKVYELTDENGEVLGLFRSERAAQRYAERNNVEDPAIEEKDILDGEGNPVEVDTDTPELAPCEECEGSGSVTADCEACDGTGEIDPENQEND